MKDDLRRQEGDSGHSTANHQLGETGDESYAYRHSGIQERHGTIPIWLALIAVLLVCWGVFYTIQHWNPPSTVY